MSFSRSVTEDCILVASSKVYTYGREKVLKINIFQNYLDSVINDRDARLKGVKCEIS